MIPHENFEYHAKIPSIGVSVTKQKVLDALSLATSIPLPEGDTTPMALNKESLLVASSMSLNRYLDERQSKPKILENKQRDISEEEITQYTDLEFGFELNEISIKIFKDSEELLSPKSPSSPIIYKQKNMNQKIQQI